MFNLIGMVVISIFCLFLARNFYRLAVATRKKSVFLGASVCILSVLGFVFGLLCIGIAPTDHWGNSHEPTWVDHLIQTGFAGLAVGYCVTKWRTRLFFRTILGIGIIYIGMLATVQALLPSLLKVLPTLLGVLVMNGGVHARSLSRYTERSRTVSSELDV